MNFLVLIFFTVSDHLTPFLLFHLCLFCFSFDFLNLHPAHKSITQCENSGF